MITRALVLTVFIAFTVGMAATASPQSRTLRFSNSQSTADLPSAIPGSGTGRSLRRGFASGETLTATASLSTPPLSTGSSIPGDAFQCLIANLGGTSRNALIQIIDASGSVIAQSEITLDPGEIKSARTGNVAQERQLYCHFVVQDTANLRAAACVQDSFGRCVTAVPAQ